MNSARKWTSLSSRGSGRWDIRTIGRYELGSGLQYSNSSRWLANWCSTTIAINSLLQSSWFSSILESSSFFISLLLNKSNDTKKLHKTDYIYCIRIKTWHSWIVPKLGHCFMNCLGTLDSSFMHFKHTVCTYRYLKRAQKRVSKVKPQLSFEGRAKTKPVLKPQFHEV